MKSIDLSIPRRRYYNNKYILTVCPECGSDLIKENCTILLFVKSDSDQGEYITNLSGSHFCNNCPVVVFDKEKIEQAAILAIKGTENIRYHIAGIINLESIPDDKKHLEIGCDENPIPLVEFLPNQLKTKTIVSDKKPGRNEICSCGSGKKYKKCCGGK